MSEDDLAMMRRAGPPRRYLIMSLLFLVSGMALLAGALSALKDPWLGSGTGAWLALIAGLAQFVPGVILLFVWRRHRVDYAEYRRIACHKCGYDRRGIDAGSACPECGMVPAQSEP